MTTNSTSRMPSATARVKQTKPTVFRMARMRDMRETWSEPSHIIASQSTLSTMTTAVALALLLVVSVALSLHPILPWYAAAGLVIAFVWMVWPGAIIARRVYAPQRAWLPALLVTPAWGFGVSSVAL